MAWVQKLVETYDNCTSSLGYSNQDKQKQRPLLPICHITAQANIEITIDGKGNFRRASLITEKNDATTIIPCTEKSASRSGKQPENHPLCDKLQYVARDFIQYGGTVTSGFANKPEEPYQNYINLLSSWCSSEFVHPKAKTVLMYVEKGSLIKDLIENKILFVGSDQKFIDKKEVEREKNAKDIFSLVNSQDDAFVRWSVEDNTLESKVWLDKTLWDSWIKYYLSTRKEKSLCLVSGEENFITTIHPKYIRREGDGAKLISSNDTSGFTFRGRFIDDQQACTVGLEASQKSHYALSWLISRQGYRKGDLAVVAWATSGATTPQPIDDPLSFLGIDDLRSDTEFIAYTAQEIGIKVKKKMAGYYQSLSNTTDVVVMGLDSATPGRLSIIFYRELTGSDFLSRINNWQTSCAWLHRYQFREFQDPETNKKKKACVPFNGAPSPNDIAEAVYGSRIDDKLRKTTITRLLPCIVDGQPIPRDLVESIVRRASNRIGLEEWDWNKTLSIACALYRKSKYGKEEYNMSLDETRTSRDYLYGRLLAVAERIEEQALYKAKEKRATNATRYMQQFSQRPYRTWNQIHSALTPYVVRLGGAFYYKNIIAGIMEQFNPNDFTNDKPLSGEYLLGYYCQRQKLIEKTKENPTSEDLDQETITEE